MQTKEVLDQGIERHFLRRCIRLGIISPPQTITKFTRNKTYAPYDFSQKDVEMVWNAYVAFKMKFTDQEMIQMATGESLPVRDSLEEHILKLQKEVEEMQAIIEFMKYVKGLGVFPPAPSELIGGKSLAEYLYALINHLDKDRNLKSMIKMAEIVNSVPDIDQISDEDSEEIENISKSLVCSEEAIKLGDKYHTQLENILQVKHLGAASEEVQKQIKEYCTIGAEMNRLNYPELNFGPFEHAIGLVVLIVPDSDIALMYRKMLGEENAEFLTEALFAFMEAEDPEKYKQYITG